VNGWSDGRYYEGKEFESKVKEKRPGLLSPELLEALGMVSQQIPPPWLINMVRFAYVRYC
jgi:splicing factor 3B subunit 2